MPSQLVLRANPASEQDHRGEVGAGAEHDGVRLEPATIREQDADSARAAQQHAVDERLAEHGEVGSRPDGIEVGERRVPADATAHVCPRRPDSDRFRGGVQVSEEREAGKLRCSDEGGMKGCRPFGVCPSRAKRVSSSLEARRDRRVRPVRPPLVVVGPGALEQQTGVVRRAAADDPGAQRAIVLAARSPVVREHE